MKLKDFLVVLNPKYSFIIEGESIRPGTSEDIKYWNFSSPRTSVLTISILDDTENCTVEIDVGNGHGRYQSTLKDVLQGVESRYGITIERD